MRPHRAAALFLVSLTVAAFLIGLLTSAASAQQGVAVFTGRVRIDGQNAPAGTVVIITLQRDGSEIGRGPTGQTGFETNQYRIDIQGNAAFEGQTVVFNVETKYVNPPVTSVFEVNRAKTVDINATATPPPATATPAPQATATTAPVATPTTAPVATIAPTATTAPTAVPTATTRPIQNTPVPSPTPAEGGGGGCSAPLARTGEIDAGWLLIGLVGPGALLTRRVRSKK